MKTAWAVLIGYASSNIANIHVFLYKKDSIRKWGSNCQNLTKIARLMLPRLVFLYQKSMLFDSHVRNAQYWI